MCVYCICVYFFIDSLALIQYYVICTVYTQRSGFQGFIFTLHLAELYSHLMGPSGVAVLQTLTTRK